LLKKNGLADASGARRCASRRVDLAMTGLLALTEHCEGALNVAEGGERGTVQIEIGLRVPIERLAVIAEQKVGVADAGCSLGIEMP